MVENTRIRIGTRNSELAMTQTRLVLGLLKSAFPDNDYEIVSMTTTGDQILDSPLHQIGSKSLFTKELEAALLEGQVDMVVHSLKDLPTTLPATLQIGAVLDRENPRDAVILSQRTLDRGHASLESLPRGSVIGTSSVRRIAQLKRNYPNLAFEDIRGNLNTRLKKLDAEDSKYDAIILAYAGVHRLGWDKRISQILACCPEEASSSFESIPLSFLPCLYAVGQGALAIECREADHRILNMLWEIRDLETELVTAAERSLLRTLEGGCSVPIGVASVWTKAAIDEHGVTEAKMLRLSAIVCSVDGAQCIESSSELPVTDATEAERLGLMVAKNLLGKGAAEILALIKRH